MSKNPLVPQNCEDLLAAFAAFADLMRELVPDDQDVEAGLDPEQIENEALEPIADARSRTPLD